MGYIHSIETMGLVDGPGVRSVVFLRGCPLRCKYCHNPDTWEAGGEETTAEALVQKLLRFRTYYKSSGGGVTFSGGDPLVQSKFLLQCLKLLKAEGIHTCVDTAGAGHGDYEEILQYTDLVLLDIKHHDPTSYRELTGGDPNQPQGFIQALAKANTPIWVRHVVVPGLTDDPAHLQALATYIRTLPNVEKVELLPYHVMGEQKYQALGIKPPLEGLPAMDKERCKQLQTTYFA